MSSPPDTLQPKSIAARVHQTTGKEYLPRICVGGFFLESFWHLAIKRRVFKTPASTVQGAMLRAAAFWPVLFLTTGATLKWAEWEMGKTEAAGKGKEE
ncbi:Uu.00g076850.m01.CDS01 [Anthostomella pinea]|uniref:Uu.00g076850.m01.CDS01 n=1 Tax=Anthostomella pinea TaxID=933095 RepID=A0AAI8VWU7_9PEZI|nr:Uu.00g076850.m01.CDS01 [Anthostomella pinea]